MHTQPYLQLSKLCMYFSLFLALLCLLLFGGEFGFQHPAKPLPPPLVYFAVKNGHQYFISLPCSINLQPSLLKILPSTGDHMYR